MIILFNLRAISFLLLCLLHLRSLSGLGVLLVSKSLTEIVECQCLSMYSLLVATRPSSLAFGDQRRNSFQRHSFPGLCAPVDHCDYF